MHTFRQIYYNFQILAAINKYSLTLHFQTVLKELLQSGLIYAKILTTQLMQFKTIQ